MNSSTRNGRGMTFPRQSIRSGSKQPTTKGRSLNNFSSFIKRCKARNETSYSRWMKYSSETSLLSRTKSTY